MNELAAVLKATNKALVVLLRRASGLHHEHATNADRHDDHVESVDEDIKALRVLRDVLEEKLRR